MFRKEAPAVNTASTSAPSRDRIPPLLQAVFLKSNRGAEVNKPPPQRLADRVFFRNWMFRGRDTGKSKKQYVSSKDKLLGKKKGAKGLELEMTTQTREPKLVVEYTLQQYFEALLTERGYTIKFYDTLSTGYYHKATPLQIASHGPRMVQIVKSSDVNALNETLGCGLSPNPCNSFGESILHMICRRGDKGLFDVMVNAGTNLQTSDDYGRTPLHDACWAAKPAFGIVEHILKVDSGLLFLKDKRGSLPLSYVHKADWRVWMDWLDKNVDNFFPESNAKEFGPPELAKLGPNSIPVSEQKDGLPLELIKMIANGDMTPEEARLFSEAGAQDSDDESTDTYSSSDFDSDDESDFDSDDESDYDSDSDIDEAEQEEMTRMIQMAERLRSSNQQ